MLQMQMNCRGAENVQMRGIIVKGLEGKEGDVTL